MAGAEAEREAGVLLHPLAEAVEVLLSSHHHEQEVGEAHGQRGAEDVPGALVCPQVEEGVKDHDWRKALGFGMGALEGDDLG